ncbi:MAG: Fic family protein [Patulibacter sp.]
MHRPSYDDFVQALTIVHGWTIAQADAATKRPLAESALAAAWAGFGDVEMYVDDVTKAAVTGARIARNHAAVDGNKRVAVLMMSAMLSTANYRIAISDDLLAELIERVAGREPVLTEEQFIEQIAAAVAPR